jgi:hypothetical protein
MIGRIMIGVVIAGCACSLASAGEIGERKSWLLTFRGTLTTGSQVFVNPESPDQFQRSDFLQIDNAFGYGAELRYFLPETNIAFGLGVEYLRTTASTRFLTTAGRGVPAEDGYRVIPIEFTGYFIIPVSGPIFSIYMGGGAGGYFGRRIYRVEGVEAGPVDEGSGYGIHVLAGLSFTLNEWFVLSMDMKFRDLQFTARNQFPDPDAASVPLPNESFPSRVHTDGIVFQIGTGISF